MKVIVAPVPYVHLIGAMETTQLHGEVLFGTGGVDGGAGSTMWPFFSQKVAQVRQAQGELPVFLIATHLPAEPDASQWYEGEYGGFEPADRPGRPKPETDASTHGLGEV